MCRSCVHPFNGKYLQQCEVCGHPKHSDNSCGVGIIRVIPRIYGNIETIGCLCKDEKYDRIKIEFLT